MRCVCPKLHQIFGARSQQVGAHLAGTRSLSEACRLGHILPMEGMTMTTPTSLQLGSVLHLGKWKS
jgi:hypothetical protein